MEDSKKTEERMEALRAELRTGLEDLGIDPSVTDKIVEDVVEILSDGLKEK